MRGNPPGGFGGRLRGKGRNSQPEPGPRRAAHPVHEHIASTQIYLHADLAVKERALARTAAPSVPPGRYRPSDTLLAFLDGL